MITRCSALNLDGSLAADNRRGFSGGVNIFVHVHSSASTHNTINSGAVKVINHVLLLLPLPVGLDLISVRSQHLGLVGVVHQHVPAVHLVIGPLAAAAGLAGLEVVVGLTAVVLLRAVVHGDAVGLVVGLWQRLLQLLVKLIHQAAQKLLGVLEAEWG